MKRLDIEIKNCIGNYNDFYVILNDKKLNLTKTPQGKSGQIDVEDGDNILEIKKKYELDNPLGILGVFFLWIKHIFSDEIGEDVSKDGRYFYRFKVKLNLKSDSKAKFYIVDKKNILVNPVSYEIFSSIDYEVLENKSFVNKTLPISYGIYKSFKYIFSIAIVGIFILLFIK